jgi:hypothetical protein
LEVAEVVILEFSGNLAAKQISRVESIEFYRTADFALHNFDGSWTDRQMHGSGGG